jgi:predicted  nucleic acid-binding Zn-ribbon protein
VISLVSDSHETGTSPGLGTFSCLRCGSQVSLEHVDVLPECPRCGASRFRRSSIFDPPPDAGEHPAQTAEFDATEEGQAPPQWLDAARERLPGAGRYLACVDSEPEIFALKKGWTRIGRSASADVRLDDPSVSRRHALIVWESGEDLRVLDDRSLNGIWLNGELVEWGTIGDGDELVIGRFKLFLLDS